MAALACGDPPGANLASSALQGIDVTASFDNDVSPVFPAVVGVGYGPGRRHCMGTLISERVVLTAAHCVDEYSTRSDEADVPSFWVGLSAVRGVVLPQSTFPVVDCAIHRAYNELNEDDLAPELVAEYGSPAAVLAAVGQECQLLNGGTRSGDSDLAVLLLGRPVPPASGGTGNAGWGADPYSIIASGAVFDSSSVFDIVGQTDPTPDDIMPDRERNFLLGVSGFSENSATPTLSTFLFPPGGPWRTEKGDSGGPLLTSSGLVAGVASGNPRGIGFYEWARVDLDNPDTRRLVADDDGDGWTNIFDECVAEDVAASLNCNALAESTQSPNRTSDACDPVACGETRVSSFPTTTPTTVVREYEQVLRTDPTGFALGPAGEILDRVANVGCRWCDCVGAPSLRDCISQVGDTCEVGRAQKYTDPPGPSNGWRTLSLRTAPAGGGTAVAELTNIIHRRRTGGRRGLGEMVDPAATPPVPLVKSVFWDTANDIPRLAASEDELDGVLWTHSIDSTLTPSQQDLASHYSTIAPARREYDLYASPCLRYAGRIPPFEGCVGCEVWLPYRFVYDGCWPEFGGGLPGATGFLGGILDDLEDYLPNPAPLESFIAATTSPIPVPVEWITSPGLPNGTTDGTSHTLMAALLPGEVGGVLRVNGVTGMLEFEQLSGRTLNGPAALHPHTSSLTELRGGSPAQIWGLSRGTTAEDFFVSDLPAGILGQPLGFAWSRDGNRALALTGNGSSLASSTAVSVYDVALRDGAIRMAATFNGSWTTADRVRVFEGSSGDVYLLSTTATTTGVCRLSNSGNACGVLSETAEPGAAPAVTDAGVMIARRIDVSGPGMMEFDDTSLSPSISVEQVPP